MYSLLRVHFHTHCINTGSQIHVPCAHLDAHAHTLAHMLSSSPFLTNTCALVETHGPHTCTYTSMSFYAHTFSCTCPHLDTPFPNHVPSIMCVHMPWLHQLALFPHTLTHTQHTCSPAHARFTSMLPLALQTPDLLAFLCFSPSKSRMAAAASPVTFSWRAPTPSQS